MATPCPRNFVASQDRREFGNSGTPQKEYKSQTVNICGTHAVYGIIGSKNYDYPKNVLNGGPLAFKAQATYQCGQIINLSIILMAHHKGHFKFKACATFVSDPKYGAPINPLYPSRAYIPLATAGPWQYDYKYRFPPNLSSDLVLLQFHYLTAVCTLVTICTTGQSDRSGL